MLLNSAAELECVRRSNKVHSTLDHQWRSSFRTEYSVAAEISTCSIETFTFKLVSLSSVMLKLLVDSRQGIYLLL